MKQWLQRAIYIWQKGRELPYVGRSLFIIALAALVVAIASGWHHSHPDDDAGAAIHQAQQAEMVVPPIILTLARILPYLNLWVTIGVPLLLIVVWRRWGNLTRLMAPVSIAAFSIALWAVASELVDYIVHSQMTETGEPPAPVAFAFKLFFIVLALGSLPVALQYYRKTLLLEHYTLSAFLQPLFFCFISFSSLWVIMDLLDNLKDFQATGSSIRDIVRFYLALLPYIYTQIMPVALLLAVLYALTRMSRANELISMLGVGRSLSQVLRPIFLVTIHACVLSMAANYYWAPRAEGNREAITRAMSVHSTDSIMASQIMFRNEQTHRIWYVGTFPFSLRSGKERMHGLQVREENADGTPARTILASSASWSPRAGWRFYDGSEMTYQNGTVTQIRPFPQQKDGQRIMGETGIEETPWGIVSYALQADYMSVPEIVSYLTAHPKAAREKLASFRTHLWQRFAQPWQAFALVLVAAPLGVAYSRRGSVGGIASSVFIFFIFMFANNLFLNLGKGDHLPPWLTVWLPHLLFGGLGLVLLHYRSENRDLPKLRLRPRGPAARVARPRNRSDAAMPDPSAT